MQEINLRKNFSDIITNSGTGEGQSKKQEIRENMNKQARYCIKRGALLLLNLDDYEWPENVVQFLTSQSGSSSSNKQNEQDESYYQEKEDQAPTPGSVLQFDPNLKYFSGSKGLSMALWTPFKFLEENPKDLLEEIGLSNQDEDEQETPL